MTGTIAVIGHPISAAGVWLQPPKPTAGLWTAADLIPVASLTGGGPEASALIAFGNATVIG